MISDEKVLGLIIERIATEPKKVTITKTTDNMGVLLEIDADKADRGLIIGKQGQTAIALRRIFKVVGAIKKIRYNIRIKND